MRIYTRREWGARHGAGYATAGAKLEYYAHHTAANRLSESSSLEKEMTVWRDIEAFHASGLTQKNPRIGYTHGVAPSGRVFEGTGWERVGAHTKGRNSSAYAAVFM